MNTWEISVDHIDTCLPCYVMDHCNGETELLLGVPVDRSTRYYQVRNELIDELHTLWDERIPKGAESAIKSVFTRVHPFKVFDNTLDSASEYESGESCYAWFRLSWSEE